MWNGHGGEMTYTSKNVTAVDLRMSLRITSIGMLMYSTRTMVYRIEPRYTGIYPYTLRPIEEKVDDAYSRN